MDKEGVIYSYTMKCYLAIKKNKMFAICSNMDGLWGHYSKWNKSVRKGQHCQISPLCGIWKIQQTSKCVKKKKNSRFRLFLFSHSVISDFVIPWTIVHQAPLSMGFSRQEYWSELLFPSPGYLPHPGIEPGSPALKADSLTTEPPERLVSSVAWVQFCS